MNIINMSFTGINAARTATPKGGVSVKNNVRVEGVEPFNMGIDQSRQAYRVLFTFSSDYSPDFASIVLKGEVLVLDTAAEASKVIGTWKNEKRLDPSVGRGILNNIMNRCSLEVILLSRELGLPSPIPLPTIKDETAVTKNTVVQKVDVQRKAAREDKPKKN
jgi:hypothetical protein